jgi:outer membrane immunogenic protein
MTTHKKLCGCALLAGAMMMAAAAEAQQVRSGWTQQITSTDLAVTYTTERAKIASSNCGCFWMNGGSIDAGVTFYRGLGLAVNLTGEHASNITPGVNLSKVTYMAGPRYTFSTSRYTSRLLKEHGTHVFGEGLFGGVHGFDSTFPGSSGTTSSTGAFSMQLGGGFDVGLARGFGIRALEVDYVHTNLSNNGSNSQNDLRLAFGVSYHLGKP